MSNGNGNGQQGGQVIDFSALPAQIMDVQPEQLPTFPALAKQIDGVMNRLPWWAVMLGTAFGVRWWLKK
jgi:hypothetical protein